MPLYKGKMADVNGVPMIKFGTRLIDLNIIVFAVITALLIIAEFLLYS